MKDVADSISKKNVFFKITLVATISGFVCRMFLQKLCSHFPRTDCHVPCNSERPTRNLNNGKETPLELVFMDA